MTDIRNLEPKSLWNYFYQITQIPRPSKKEEKIIAFMKKFGDEHNLTTDIDEIGNVVIRKAATSGMENRKVVIFQTHLDMVPQKNSNKIHDFEKDPIETVIDGDWVRANGTTLGSDNGIGVAAVMAVLASKDIEHGPLEALFTVDEETGMTGAFGLRKDILSGDILINLDSEDEGELYVGCAGGINVNIRKEYGVEKTPSGMVACKISLKGLKGGHSGIDIPLGKANSNKLMFRFLMQAEADFGIRLAEVKGGDLRNAIPREAQAIIGIPEIKKEEFARFVEEYEMTYKAEFSDTEPDLSFTCEKMELPENVMNQGDQYRIIRAVFACPNGVQRMSQAMKGLVETSTNLAIVKCSDGIFESENLTRSSVDSAKEAVAWRIAAIYHLIEAEVTLNGDYPGWKPNINSPVLKIMSDLYNDLFGNVPEIKAIHAGLECGILGGIYPGLDMISLGPTIRYPHSPDEKVNIESVDRFWKFIVHTLKHIPASDK
jgi:dipeptidase D